MARFVFSLQTVLDQRLAAERECQLDLARARAVLVEREAKLAQLNAEIVAANEHMRDHHLVGKINVGIIATHRRFLIAMRTTLTTLATEIAKARLDVEANQKKLNAAVSERKAIQTLHDKQKSRWTAEQNRREVAMADDVGMQIAFANLTATGGSVG